MATATCPRCGNVAHAKCSDGSTVTYQCSNTAKCGCVFTK